MRVSCRLTAAFDFVTVFVFVTLCAIAAILQFIRGLRSGIVILAAFHFYVGRHLQSRITDPLAVDVSLLDRLRRAYLSLVHLLAAILKTLDLACLAGALGLFRHCETKAAAAASVARIAG